jgi:outer membrane protein assembly factor BamB
MNGDGVDRRTVLAGLGVAGLGMVAGAGAAVTAKAGTLLWRSGTPAGLTTLVPADGVVCAGIVGTRPNTLSGVYAINAATGKEAWTQWAGPLPIIAGPGMVYCTGSELVGGAILAVDTAHGKELWVSLVDNPGGPPAWGLYDAGTVYAAVTVGSTLGVAAVSGYTGKEHWFARNPFAPTALAVGGGAVYTGWQTDAVLGAGEVTALDAATGALRWTTRFGGTPVQLAVTDTVIVGNISSVASFALDASTGTVLWQSRMAPARGLAAGNGVVYTPGPLAARDARTGRYLWRQDGGDDQPGQLILVGETLYAAYSNLRIRALSALTGSQLWSYTLPASGTSIETGLMVAGSGALYLTLQNSSTGDDLSNVYAIKT